MSREILSWAVRRRLRIGAVVAGLAAVAAASALPGGAAPASAAATCAASHPSNNAYTVTLCITAPAAGATITGSTTVTSTISVSGTNPGVRELVFTLNSGKLLWDFQSPYSWALDSTRWVDGTYALHVSAIMRDGFTTPNTSENLTFSNGISTPPVNSSSFTPSTGTPAAPGQPFVVAAVGDGGAGQTAESQVVNLISSWNPNLFLYLGDVYEDGRPMEFDNWYGKPGTAGTFGKFYANTDPTVGNHEYVGSDLTGYQWYWNNVPHYYSFDAGGWHFVALDDIPKFIGTSTSNANYQAETTWLKNDLASNQLACTIVFYHEPAFNVGSEGVPANAAPLWQILAKNHVTMVLNGHDHDYQRYVPLDAGGNPSAKGVTEFVAGGGGHGLQQAVKTDSRLAASDFTHYGALRLSLGTSGASYEYVTTSGTTVDSGSLPCEGTTTDTTAPTQPQNLTAAAVSRTQVQLSWDASTDNVGVTAYDIYRDGTLLASVAPPAGYLDESVQPGTSYSYTVVARDAAGNASPASDPASVTTPTDVTMFSDGFESGDMSQWATVAGMTVQSQVVNDGLEAAEAAASGSPAYAYAQLGQSWPALYYSTRFYVASQGASTVYLLRFRTGSKVAIAALSLSSTDKLALRNDITGITTTSSVTVSKGAWHSLEMYASVNGDSSQVSVWLDGSPVSGLGGTQSLGTSQIGFLQLGDNSTGKTFDVIFDDVHADPLFIQP
jgi:chitodextrinase